MSDGQATERNVRFENYIEARLRREMSQLQTLVYSRAVLNDALLALLIAAFPEGGSSPAIDKACADASAALDPFFKTAWEDWLREHTVIAHSV